MSDKPTDGPRIAVVLGTTRPQNYTSKALALVAHPVPWTQVCLTRRA